MTPETLMSYDFDEDAVGFAPFIQGYFDGPYCGDEFVVYVEDEQGRTAKNARFVRQTLTDGSTVTNLVITFED